ncbi:arsenic resistance protein [Fusibacter paucivorans]|uniref:Arsenic resistance protein n=1 Tax=Fusibacter paucivorans TaxID=76009 RepID=A0ABS5PSL0_9FIRM|nr:bile acid:sodium symporter [Fusibacter paucivorans]MBS7528158.1 arsenic resistance protein [Fusibacter paucivorans]
MWQILKKINKNLIVAIPTIMVIGFIYGLFNQTAFLKSFILPFTFLMVYPMMVTLKVKQILTAGDTKAQLLSQGINFLIIPFIAYALGKVFFANYPYMALGLVLASLLPTSGMTISWTGFAKGNVASAVKMTVIGLTLGSLLTPFYLKFLMGAYVTIDLIGIVRQIVLIVFLPMVLGFITQQGLIRRYGEKTFQTTLAPRFPALSSIGVLGIVFISIALKAKTIAASPGMLLQLLIPLVILYAINYIISTFVGLKLLDRGNAIALVYGTVMRNLSIALAVAINVFAEAGSDAALVIAAAYIIQVQSAAWYVKLNDKIFGRQHSETLKAELASETAKA